MTPPESSVQQWLTEHAGIEPSLLVRPWFDHILRDRLRSCGVGDEASYCDLLRRDPNERQEILQRISVNETWFFRYPESFELLRRELQRLPARRATSGALRMLSIACATGQEPYGMAMTAAAAGWPLHAFMVDAVDRDTDSLDVARRGLYRTDDARDAVPPWAQPWITRVGARRQVDRNLQARVRFLAGDVLATRDATFETRYQVVFCRNLMIYLNQVAREKLMQRMRRWLAPGGLLFVGHAECLELFQRGFQWLDVPHAFALLRVDNMAVAAAAAPRDADTRGDAAAHRRSVGVESAPAGPVRRARLRGAQRAPTGPTIGHQKSPTGRHQSNAMPPASATRGLDRAHALANIGRLHAALKVVRQVLETGQPDAEAYALAGSIYSALGQYDPARHVLLKSVYLDPEREDTLLTLAVVLRRLGSGELADHYQAKAYRVHHMKYEGPPP